MRTLYNRKSFHDGTKRRYKQFRGRSFHRGTLHRQKKISLGLAMFGYVGFGFFFFNDEPSHGENPRAKEFF